MIRNIFKILLFPLLGRIRSAPKPKPLPALQSGNLHLFAAVFGSEIEATDYALGQDPKNSLTADLGGAAIGPDDVEIVFGDNRISAALPMFAVPDGAKPPKGANTLILLSDRGQNCAMGAGDKLTYLGLCPVS